jgi:long-chain fatty acid transport protein
MTRLRVLWVVVALLTLRAVLVATSAHASSLELYGFGPRAIAMGNASEAISDDYYAVYENPANLVLAKHIHFGFGTDLILNRFGIDRTGGQPEWPSRLPQDNYLMHMGVSTPLPGWLQDRAALAVAFHLPISGPTRLDSLDYRIPQLPVYDTLGDRLALVFGVSVRPLPWMTLGASGQVLTALSGRSDIALSPLDHRVDSKSLQVNLSTEVFPILGVTVLPRDDVRLALVWRGKSEVRYALPLNVNVEQVGMMTFAVAGVGLWLPDTLAAAGSWQTGKWLWTGGLAWQRWSELPPLAPTVTLSLDNAQLVQPGGTKADILYAHNQPVPMGAQDIVVPRAGVEWRPHPQLALRTGVQYRPTPLPKADGVANYLDSPATTATFGAGITLDDPLSLTRKPLQVDVGLGWTSLMRRTVLKADPFDPVGGTSVYGDSWHLAVALHHDF